MARVPRLAFLVVAAALWLVGSAPRARQPDRPISPLFVRFRVIEPAAGRFSVDVRGYLHQGPEWEVPQARYDVVAGEWSPWINAGLWPLHPRLHRAGGLAEWPSMTLTASIAKQPAPTGVRFAVQLADRPTDDGVVVTFSERGAGNAVGFLLPHPIREHLDEFETAATMTARHRAWATDASGGAAVRPRLFTLATTVTPHYDPALGAEEVESLGLLGFSTIDNGSADPLADAGMRVLGRTWIYEEDPEVAAAKWHDHVTGPAWTPAAASESRWRLDRTDRWIIANGVRSLTLSQTDPAKVNRWFGEYLRARGVAAADVGSSLDSIAFPRDEVGEPVLARSAPLATRRLLYHAARFRQWWSARQLRQTTDLIKGTFPAATTDAMPASHGFFNAWGPPHMGMSAALLDLFELGEARAADILTADDGLGLNHMPGPDYTWSGAQSFGYLSAILRSAIRDAPVRLFGRITPSDDRYLQLKASSSLGQGAKGFFLSAFGPTYLGTDTYWSDLRSEYDGVARLARTLARAEPVLHPAQPIRDPVAILYSVSHDIWHTDEPAAFVEMRLLWHALRHLGVQPDFLREEDLERGRLGGYRVLYVTGHSIGRCASTAIDLWVRSGGVVSLAAGAATRDEFYEPYQPSFASAVWPPDAVSRLVRQRAQFNERVDLPVLPPLSFAWPDLPGADRPLPVLGYQLDLRTDLSASAVFATFGGSAPAGAAVAYGEGRVIAFGFMPMLAYGQMARFQPVTLAEVWPAEPRALVRLALDAAGVVPAVELDVPVVEASLLTGPAGSALVLANYTYLPLSRLRIRVRVAHPVGQVSTTENAPVRWTPLQDGGLIELPLEWTDIVMLPRGAMAPPPVARR